MSSKEDLYNELYEFGYQIGPYTSKETLINIRRLHSLVLTDHNVHVARLNDLELRKALMKHGLLVGPVTNQTRSIYQRKLLEILSHETTEGYDSDEPIDSINDENQLYPNLLLSERKNFSYGLPDRYNEPMTIRNDYKATKSTRTTTYSDRNFYDDSKQVRSRISTTSNEQLSSTKMDENSEEKPRKNSGGSFFYISMTIIIALIVFALYFILN